MNADDAPRCTLIGRRVYGIISTSASASNANTVDFDDGSPSTFAQVAPYVRWFAATEAGDVPVSLALAAQYFIDDFEGDDTGAYLRAGPTVYKRLRLGEVVTLDPFLGFALVGESYTFGGSTDRAA